MALVLSNILSMFQLIQISAKRMSQKTNSATEQLHCITEDSVNVFSKARTFMVKMLGCWIPQTKVKPPKEITEMCMCLWDVENIEQFQGEK